MQFSRLGMRTADVKGLAHSRRSTDGSSYYLCSRIKCSSPMVPLSVCQVTLNTHLLIQDTKLPKAYWFRKKVQRPNSLDVRATCIVSIVRSHPLNAPVICSSTLKLWKCNKQSCPHNHLMVIVVIDGLSMQRSCPEGVEMGGIIAEGLCR